MLLRKHFKTRIWCVTCKMECDFVNDAEISVLVPKLDGTINYDNLHKYQEPDGTTMICLSSVFNNWKQ